MNKIFSFLVSGVHFDSQVVSPNLQTHTHCIDEIMIKLGCFLF